MEDIHGMSCLNCGSAFHEKWACPKPPRIAEEAKGNAGASAGRLHSQKTVPTESPANVPASSKRGRPKTITDMKAYKAERERIYRARKKAET